jgi:O-acetyl-ADP-ribose deacetylase (regulator of RNase III)
VVALTQGDITAEQVDAIVNAANSQLRHGAGVAGAIVSRGGMEIQRESDAWVRQHGPVAHPEPAYTRAGRLPCRYVIHAVGPVWGEGEEDAKLAAAVTGSLRCAEELELQSIAFPAISTGIFGFPRARAARVMLEAIQRYLMAEVQTNLRQVRLVLYDPPSLQAFDAVWAELGWDA